MKKPASTSSIPIARPWLPDHQRFSAITADIFERRYVSNFAKYSGLLEERASHVLGQPALALASCDIGLTLAWRALGLTSGEVIVPSFTFASTANAIVWNSLTPVFADVEPDTLCIAPDHVRSLIGPNTVAIAGVHVFGHPVSPEIDSLASRHGLALVFDAAHGVGTTVGGHSLAARGDLSVFSLSGTKPVTAGEGGLVTARSERLLERMRLLRGYGFSGDYNVKHTGLNGKMSELNAAMGYLSFGMYEELVARRMVIAGRYREHIEGGGLGSLQPPPADADTRSYKDLVVTFRDALTRERVQKHLHRNKIGTKRYFLPVHTMDAYHHHSRDALSVTDSVWGSALCLPIFHDLTLSEVDWICALIKSACR